MAFRGSLTACPCLSAPFRSYSRSMTIEPPSTVLIVGAGAFGASTALALCDGPYRGREQLITILERSAQVGAPAIDAASHDYNKIIR